MQYPSIFKNILLLTQISHFTGCYRLIFIVQGFYPVKSQNATQIILHNLLKVVLWHLPSVRLHQCKLCKCVLWHGILFRDALFVLSLFLCVWTLTFSAQCGCHKALVSMIFRMFHLISLTSPVSRGAKQQLREPQHPVEQSWLTYLPEGSALSQA